MKVYVVITDSFCDDYGVGVSARIFSKREDAEGELNKLYEEELKTDWFDKKDYAKGDYFAFWQDGYYDVSHYHACVEEHEVE